MIQYREGNSIIAGDPEVVQAQRQAQLDAAAQAAQEASSKSLSLALVAGLAGVWWWARKKLKSRKASSVGKA